MSDSLVVIDHPLIQHKLTLMRDRRCPTLTFRQLLREIGSLMTLALTADLPTVEAPIETPLEPMTGACIDGDQLALVSILRAGLGLTEGILDMVPSARVGHVGMYRDHDTLEAIEYYFKLPPKVEDSDLIVVDPMLATGHTAIAAVERILQEKPRSIRLACLLAAPEGIKAFHDKFPSVRIFTTAIDRQLDHRGYILPGLGDAGDRMFGT